MISFQDFLDGHLHKQKLDITFVLSPHPLKTPPPLRKALPFPTTLITALQPFGCLIPM